MKYDKLVKRKTYNDYPKMSNILKKKDIDFIRLFLDIRGTSIKSYFYNIKRVQSFDLSNKIKKIKIPTLIIHGTQDKIFSKKSAIEMNKKIKGSKLHFLNTGHLPVFSNIKELKKLIWYFIKNL